MKDGEEDVKTQLKKYLESKKKEHEQKKANSAGLRPGEQKKTRWGVRPTEPIERRVRLKPLQIATRLKEWFELL